MTSMSAAIDVFCSGHLDMHQQATHERWTVVRWRQIDGEWSTTKRLSDLGEPLRLLKDQGQAQMIHEDKPIVEFEDWRTDARTRYRLECTKCGLTVVFKKTEELSRLLDTLLTHGVSELSLSALAARLT